MIFELKWGELLYQKSEVEGLTPEDAKDPGKVEAQFIATESSQSKWLMGVPEGSIKDLQINRAVADPLPDPVPGVDSKAAVSPGVKPAGKIVPNQSSTPAASPSALKK